MVERKREDPEFVARLQEECRARNWDQHDLQKGLEISRSFASQLWNGSVPLGPKNLRKLADLKFDLNWLISGKRIMGKTSQDEIDRLYEELKNLKFYVKQLERLITQTKSSKDDETGTERGPNIDPPDSRINP